MATGIPIGNIPVTTPDSADSVLGFDAQTGKARRFGIADIASGGSVYDTVTATANGALSGHRAVGVSGGQASYADATTQPNVTGITQGAASNGASVVVQTTGELVEPSWNWSNGPVYLASNGLLTQAPPSSGALVEVGTALSPTKLLIRIQSPIYL